MRSLFFSLAAIAIGLAADAVAAPEPASTPSGPSCVVVTLLDQDNLPIRTTEPVIGLLLGGSPVVEETAPAHSARKAGAPAACPPTLVAHVKELYEASCTSQDRRERAAAENKVVIEFVNNGCINMRAALTGTQPSEPIAAPQAKTTLVPQKSK